MSLHVVDSVRLCHVSRLEQDDQEEEDILVAVPGPVAHLALCPDKPVHVHVQRNREEINKSERVLR